MASFLVLLLLALSSLISTLADVSWNIDCGASGSHTDGKKIEWTGDDALIKAGKSRSVPAGNSQSDHLLDTLRAFTSGSRNCYFLKAEKGAKVLFRANFFYGDYDGKLSPPMFNMEIDGNEWITMQTTMIHQFYDYAEVIYMTKGDSISVCFIRTHHGQFPFVSSLQIQSLPSNMYQHLDADHALFYRGRFAFGSNESISYPDDAYSRIWDPASIVGSGFSTVARSNTSSIDLNTVPDKPPRAVMDNAMTTSNSSARSMRLPPFPNMPTSPNPMYINMYFTEVVDKLNSSGERRSFDIYIDDKPVQSIKPVMPAYGNVTELSIYDNILATENTTFTFVSTSNSTLPPLISAVEVFMILDYTQVQVSYSAKGGTLPMILSAVVPMLLILVALG